MTPPTSGSPFAPRFETGALTGKVKLDDVKKLLATLKEDLSSSSLRPEDRKSALERLKIHGRDPKDAEPIFTRDGIEVLTKHGLDRDTTPSSLEALRCLANTMLLEPKTRQMFVDLGYAGRAAERLKSDDSDNEFLISRILFLTTYETNLRLDPLFEKNALSESINNHIHRHAEQFNNDSEKSQPSSFEQAALSECLKLLFNLSSYYPHRISTFTPSIGSIFKILTKIITIPSPPLQPPINYLINALVNLNLDHQASHSFPTTSLTTLTHILDLTLSSYPPATLPSHLPPLLTLLRKLSTIPTTKPHLQSLLLPSDSDRDLPLGQSATLPSKLLRLSTTPSAPTLRDAISALLFDLSDRDPTTFVRNVGYGHAAGFLLSHNIPVPEAAGQVYPTSSTEADGPEGDGNGDGEELTNPITGQKLSKEVPVEEGPEMSQEEKEREAERLFVLFERLRATGVVSVGDPVREAVESGMFEGPGSGGRNGSGNDHDQKGRVAFGRVEELDDDDDDS